MAITTELETILNARYGREVRQAIHDGIKQAYEDAIANGNANMEVSQARGSYPTLATRLTSIVNTLEKKIAKGNVTMADLTQEVKEVLNGDRPLPIVAKDSVIGYENIVKGTVTPEETNFVVIGKNIFDGTYTNGRISGNTESGGTLYLNADNASYPNGRVAIIKINQDQDYTISKEVSERFRVGLTNNPTSKTAVNLIKDEYHGGGDSDTKFTFHSGQYEYVVIFVTLTSTQLPDFMQVEKGTVATSFETFGYEFKDKVTKIASDDVKDGKVYVENFTGSDTEKIKKAFGVADGQIVAFESGKDYHVTEQLKATISKVIGIDGNGATIHSSVVGIPALVYEGSLEKSLPTDPYYPENKFIMREEMGSFIDRLNVTSEVEFNADGIQVGKTIGVTVQNCKLYGLRNGLIFKNIGRNYVAENNFIYNNTGVGMWFKDTDLHQANVIGGHISYNQQNIKFTDSDIANIQISAVSIENANTRGSHIKFENTGVLASNIGKAWYEVVILSGLNIQDHTRNTEPIIHIDSANNMEVVDLIIGDCLIGNCGETTVPMKIGNVKRLSINNINIQNNKGTHSIVFDGYANSVRISNSYLDKSISYSGATTNTMIFNGNHTNGFELPDGVDGKVKFVNNVKV